MVDSCFLLSGKILAVQDFVRRSLQMVRAFCSSSTNSRTVQRKSGESPVTDQNTLPEVCAQLDGKVKGFVGLRIFVWIIALAQTVSIAGMFHRSGALVAANNAGVASSI
jgi:hypothetical protein